MALRAAAMIRGRYLGCMAVSLYEWFFCPIAFGTGRQAAYYTNKTTQKARR
jgi:hypothetical protein